MSNKLYKQILTIIFLTTDLIYGSDENLLTGNKL